MFSVRPLYTREAVLLGAVAALTVFVFDLTQPLGIAGGAPYATLPLLGLLARSRRTVIALALASTLLTLVGTQLSATGASPEVVVLNRSMSTVLVWVTAAIALHHLAIGARLRERLENQVARDPLTDLFNRRHVFEVVEDELRRYHRYREDCSLILIDADHFKRVNDLHGHPAGDATLRRIADVCRQSVREADVVGRFGGEEFIVVLPHTNAWAAAVVAERIRAGMALADVVWEDRRIHVTLSLGVAQVGPGSDSFDGLLKAADRALYRAKAAGRDRVAIAGLGPSRPPSTRKAA